MSEQFLSKINWQQPWLLPLRDIAHSVLQQQNWKHEINRLMQEQSLCNFAGQPLQCIPQQDLPEGEQYETHIHSTGGIPTRDNLHDFFNALMWLRFPQIKKMLVSVDFSAMPQPCLMKTQHCGCVAILV